MKRRKGHDEKESTSKYYELGLNHQIDKHLDEELSANALRAVIARAKGERARITAKQASGDYSEGHPITKVAAQNQLRGKLHRDEKWGHHRKPDPKKLKTKRKK
jgi:hypothetical protein